MSAAGHSKKQYVVIFLILIAFTLLELGVVYTPIPRNLIITALVGLALAKALAVALYFMHLKSETKYLRMMLGLPLLFPPFYAVVLMLEAFWHTPFYR